MYPSLLTVLSTAFDHLSALKFLLNQFALCVSPVHFHDLFDTIPIDDSTINPIPEMILVTYMAIPEMILVT